MSILDDVRIAGEARKALAQIAAGEDVRLTSEQAKSIQKHMRWLSNERDSLLSSGCFDD